MLTLPIKKKWYDMILSGEKKEEYRSFNKYYGARFSKYGIDNGFRLLVAFRNGYGRHRPTLICEVEVNLGYSDREDWGAVKGELYHVLKIHSVEEQENEI